MIFTIGALLAIAGFCIGHLFGDRNRYVYNFFDIVACTMFVGGMGLVFTSIFTITWTYMP
jgi:hypothetical protein